MKKKIFSIIVYVFAAIGLIFTGVFVAMHFGLLNVRGSIADRNASFGSIPLTSNVNDCVDIKVATCDWSNTVQWKVVHDGLAKDSALISDISIKTSVSSRMIAAAVVPEQVRFFASNREIFKSYFEPLKILGSLSQFSLGVSGIKQDTAVMIEKYANDPTSDFYPGAGIAELLAYKTDANHDAELYARLTDSKNHYYSYLYTAIYLKEIQSQWEKQSFDIKNRPDVLVTLFNLGFAASKPKANPQVSGSVITVGGKDYSFGLLGSLFYNSDELNDVFPK